MYIWVYANRYILYASLSYILEYSKLTAIPLKDCLGDSYKQGKVASVDLEAKRATLEDGSTLDFSHMVLATGSTGVYPAKTDCKNLQELEEENVAVAKDV